MYKALVKVLGFQKVGQKQAQEATVELELEWKEQVVQILFHFLIMALPMQQRFVGIEVIQGEKPKPVRDNSEYFQVVA